jgi:hypothetical protein
MRMDEKPEQKQGPEGETPVQARRGLRRVPPIEAQPEFPPLELVKHRDLLLYQKEITARFNAHPELAVMLSINPVLAFRDVNVTLSPEVTHHILETMQYPPELARRRDELIAGLREKLGEAPKPADPEWVAKVLFEKLGLAPLDVGDRQPLYRSPLTPAQLARLQELRPTLRPAPEATGFTRRRGTAITIAAPRPATYRMDVETPAAAVPRAAQAPSGVKLEELYFYKDQHPVARALLDLAIIQRQAYPIHTGDSYRKIKAGEKLNAFRSWVTKVHFPTKAPA